jgi:metal-responsive CopG/Arc/MetJ family transcriptional regulator
MTAKGKKQASDAAHSLRASVSFPSDLYRTLAEMAKQRKVSVAWMVREAAEKYVADQHPLLQPPKATQ